MMRFVFVNKTVQTMKTTTLLSVFVLGLLFAVPSFGSLPSGTSLNALLIVGHQEDGTAAAIEDMNRIAKLFKRYGVRVHKYYDQKAQWNDIVKTAKDCHFLVYCGHGSTMGKNGNAGGLCIRPFISTKRLLAELKLPDNALVVFKSVCRGAGSSAGDKGDIGLPMARNRVCHYAYPFFEVGATAYYANNYPREVSRFLEDILKGVPLQEAYTKTATRFTTIEFEEPFKRDPSKFFSIASRKGGRTGTRITYTNGVKSVEEFIAPKSYEIAYIGPPEFSIRAMK